MATEAAAGIGGATRDRELGELKLHSLQLLAPATMLRLLGDSCRELRLSDAAALAAALRKMSRALGALPKMEAFIHSVCALVLYEAPPGAAAAPPAEGGVPEQVLATLRGWVASLRELRQLRGCVEELSADVRSRDLVAGEAPTAELKAAPPLSPAELSAAVRELKLTRSVARWRRSTTSAGRPRRAANLGGAADQDPRALPAPLRRQVERGRAAEDERALPLRERGGDVHARRPRHARPRRRRLGPHPPSQLRRVLDLGVVGAAQPRRRRAPLPGSPDGKRKRGRHSGRRIAEA